MGISNIEVYKRWMRKKFATRLRHYPVVEFFYEKQDSKLGFEIEKINPKKAENLIIHRK